MILVLHLRELRAEKGISQQVVANYLGITRQAYSNYENGTREPDNEVLLKLANYFCVTVDVLLRGREEGADPLGELAEYLEDLRERPETRVLLEASRGMTREQVEKMADFAMALRGGRVEETAGE